MLRGSQAPLPEPCRARTERLFDYAWFWHVTRDLRQVQRLQHYHTKAME